jgi:clan AA aspartic protease
MTKLILENVVDVGNAEAGTLPTEDIRRAEVDALVDTGSVMLVLPRNIVDALGLPIRERRVASLADGSTTEVGRVTGVRVEILGRDMTTDALVVPTGATVLIGQVQLEVLDLVVDPRNQELRTNPRSPDVWMFDMLGVPAVSGPSASAELEAGAR